MIFVNLHILEKMNILSFKRKELNGLTLKTTNSRKLRREIISLHRKKCHVDNSCISNTNHEISIVYQALVVVLDYWMIPDQFACGMNHHALYKSQNLLNIIREELITIHPFNRPESHENVDESNRIDQNEAIARLQQNIICEHGDYIDVTALSNINDMIHTIEFSDLVSEFNIQPVQVIGIEQSNSKRYQVLTSNYDYKYPLFL